MNYRSHTATVKLLITKEYFLKPGKYTMIITEFKADDGYIHYYERNKIGNLKTFKPGEYWEGDVRRRKVQGQDQEWRFKITKFF